MKKYVFVSDLFIEQYVGGAELTTQSIIDSCASTFKKINSQSLTSDFISSHKDWEWIICNFANLEDKNKLLICKNKNYSIIEYDYKFCKYRSPEKHQVLEGKECDCLEKKDSRINLVFYGHAKKIWFMSKNQMNIFLNKVSTIKKDRCSVLSSIFSLGDLRFINSIKDNEKNDTYIILKSNSWIKGTNKSVEFAKKNNLKFELVSGLQYHEMLIKMSTAKGLIFQPLGADTCPRIVIEAFLLGCDLILNDNVQHKDEKWFSDRALSFDYLKIEQKSFGNFMNKKTIIVMGNGPSLANVDFSLLDGYDTFGLNSAYRAYKRMGWWPTYHGCFDYRVTDNHKSEFQKLITESPIQKCFYIRDFGEHKKHQFVNLQNYGSTNRFNNKVEDFNTFHDNGNSGANACSVSVCLGYEKIILLGVDCNYVELVDGAKSDGPGALVMEKTPDKNPNYWFDDYQQKGDEFNVPAGFSFHMPTWNKFAYRAAHAGIEVVNCSPITTLRCFKRKTIEEALS